jgi:hypothetical protein
MELDDPEDKRETDSEDEIGRPMPMDSDLGDIDVACFNQVSAWLNAVSLTCTEYRIMAHSNG